MKRSNISTESPTVMRMASGYIGAMNFMNSWIVLDILYLLTLFSYHRADRLRHGRKRLGLGIHMLYEIGHRRMHHPKGDIRVEPDDKNEYDKRQRSDDLSDAHVREVLVVRVGYLAEGDPLVQPEHVAGAEDDPDRGDHRVRRKVLERAEQDRELADKTVRTGKADGRERNDHEKGRVYRHLRRDPAVIRDHPRVGPLVDDANGEE